MKNTFAHCNGELDRNFDYYGGEDGGLFGHAFEGHYPDFTWWRPVKAMRMSERVYADLRNIIQNNGRYANPEQAIQPGVTDAHWTAIADTVRRFLEFPDSAGNIGGAARITETATGFDMTRASTLAKIRILFPGLPEPPADPTTIADQGQRMDAEDLLRLPNELGHPPGTYRSVPTTHGAELLMTPLIQ